MTRLYSCIMPEPKLYDWSVTIGTACNNKMRTFVDLDRAILWTSWFQTRRFMMDRMSAA
jgi:hypothetical protein